MMNTLRCGPVTTEGLFFTALVIAVVALIGVVEKRRFDDVVRSFRAVADDLEGKVTRTDFGKRMVEAVVELRGVTVVARWRGRPGLSVTTIWTECSDTEGLDILVRPCRGGDGLEVITNDEDRSRNWIRRSTKAAMMRAAPYRFRLAHGRVEATRAGPERNPETLMTAMVAVVRLSRPVQTKESYNRLQGERA